MPESPGRSVPVEALSLEDWRRCISVSLDGTFLFSKQAAVMMKVARSGALVITSSTAGLFGVRCRSPYVTAKWGVIGLIKTLAAELGPFNIRANAICPGPVDSEWMERVLEHEALMSATSRDELYAHYAAGSSMQSFVTAADVANMAVFLASDAARLVSGQAIAVDGNTENPAPAVLSNKNR
ncbi:MAG: SDR family oxidoreductase [Pseudomonadota bacterium]|nr:SDR family oxidoreductase [Pseudomonadota bacterium]